MQTDIIQRMAATGFQTRRWFEVLKEYQPEVLELWHDYAVKIQRHVELDPKVHEFIMVAIDAVVDWENIDSHINKAFDAGATIQELIDVSVTAAYLMGPHALHSGITGLDRVIKARREAGLPVPRDKSELGAKN
jgi:alkylhydroperoxidase/carboxymuconolactone decarboxylase family protein YurZ